MRCIVIFLLISCLATVLSWKPLRPWSKGDKCTKSRCENFNKSPPKRNTNKRKYCKKVKCIKPVEACECPLNYEPVCDASGNHYDNLACAICEGLSKEEVTECEPFEIGIIGAQAPGEGEIF